MRKSALISTALFLLTVAVFTAPALPQEAKAQEAAAPSSKAEQRYYHLEFVFKEINDDGRVVNSRTYDTSASTVDGRNSSVRAGTKIPVRTNNKAGDIQIEYIDVGVNIDCGSARETPQGLALQITAEISSLANPSSSGEWPPIVRQNRWSSMTQLPLGKPTVVFSSDNLENKGRMQVEVTATQIR
jgi:hypothetical protein